MLTTPQEDRILRVNSWASVRIEQHSVMRLSGTCDTSDWSVRVAGSSSHWPKYYYFGLCSALSTSQWISCYCGNTRIFIHHCFHSIQPLGSISGPNQLNSHLLFVTYSNPFNTTSFIQIFETKLYTDSFIFIPVMRLTHIVCIYYRATTEIHFIYSIRKPTCTAC